MICNICVKEIKNSLIVVNKKHHPVYTIKKKRVIISHYEDIKEEFIIEKTFVEHCDTYYCKRCLDFFNKQIKNLDNNNNPKNNICPKCLN